MAIALTQNNVGNLQNTSTAQTTINTNYSALTTALQDGLSRTGNSPNTMSANLDMNSNHILNLPAPGGPLEPVRLTDVTTGINVVNGPVSYGSAPATKVGLSALTGVALTVAHSDSVPALDQTISPTWTGTHTFPGAGVTMAGATSGTTVVKASATASGVLTLPATTDTLVGKATTDIFTNKTLTTPAINGGTIAGVTISGTNTIGGTTTISAPVLSGVTTGTYTLGGTPTISSPTISTPTISGGTINNTAIGGTTTAAGAFTTLTGTAVTGSNSILITGGTAGIGYSTGNGLGSIATQQGTNRNTAMTCNSLTGRLPLVSALTAANTTNAFVVNNTTVAATDVIIINMVSGGTATGYTLSIGAVAAGSFTVVIRNNAALTEAPILAFAVIKGSTT